MQFSIEKLYVVLKKHRRIRLFLENPVTGFQRQRELTVAFPFCMWQGAVGGWRDSWAAPSCFATKSVKGTLRGMANYDVRWQDRMQYSAKVWNSKTKRWNKLDMKEITK